MCSYDILSTVFVLGMTFIIIWPKIKKTFFSCTTRLVGYVENASGNAPNQRHFMSETYYW